MTEHVPFYRWSIKDAVHQNELESWKVSYDENCACARAMEEALDEAEESGGLKPDSAAPLLERFGFDRTMWVLAATIRRTGSLRNIPGAMPIGHWGSALQMKACVGITASGIIRDWSMS